MSWSGSDVQDWWTCCLLVRPLVFICFCCSFVAVTFCLLLLTFVLSNQCLVFFFSLFVPYDRPIDPVIVLGSCPLLLTESWVVGSLMQRLVLVSIGPDYFSDWSEVAEFPKDPLTGGWGRPGFQQVMKHVWNQTVLTSCQTGHPIIHNMKILVKYMLFLLIHT